MYATPSSASAAVSRFTISTTSCKNAEWFGYAVCMALTARFALTAWHNPVRNNDEYGTWALRGIILSAGHLDPLIMGGAANGRTYQNRDYPIGLSALYSWVRDWVGPNWSEYAGHVQVPLLAGGGMIIALWALAKVFGKRAYYDHWDTSTGSVNGG